MKTTQKGFYRKVTKKFIRSSFWHGDEYESTTEWVPCKVLGETEYYLERFVPGPAMVRDKIPTLFYLIEIDGERMEVNSRDVMLPLE